jgi:D-alanine-D-alanine ligase-like ATP-grasp enzyme
MKRTIAIVAGGDSSELVVSLRSHRDFTLSLTKSVITYI